MEKNTIITLTDNFEAHAQQMESGVEFWLARDLQHLLGYAQWKNFTAVISKAKTACEVSGHEIPDHFADAGKMADPGSGSQREIDDVMLTSYTLTGVFARKPFRRPKMLKKLNEDWHPTEKNHLKILMTSKAKSGNE